MTSVTLRGLPGSRGTGVGRLLWVTQLPRVLPVVPATNGSSRIASEKDRLRTALSAAAAELDALALETAARAGEDVGAIFEAQALFAHDPGIVNPAMALIDAGAGAAEAIERAAGEQADILAAADDTYFRERAADLRDVARRVVDRLEGRARPDLHHRDGTPAIIAADDLEPSVVAALRRELVAGIALANGATTGHTAIVARALEIPLVMGLGPSLEATLDGRAACLDGVAGRLIVDPTEDDVRGLHASPAPTRSPAVSIEAGDAPKDHSTWVSIEANVGSVREAELAAASNADGIGLVRTELLFLGRAVPPGMAEQRALYRGIAAAMPGRPVVFRTLDVGGDKPAAYAGTVSEENPALGVRGIRLGLRRPDLLELQFRALMEASPDSPLRILLPMVATLEEVHAARDILDRARAAARAAGASIASDVRLGVMIEVPSAALLADVLARAVDFFSIGSNDLVQYTLAADRTNPILADLASPLQPALLRLIASVVRAAGSASRPVSVCGEAAADPVAGPILVGLGVTELSVAPQSIAEVRARLTALGPGRCRAAAKEALAAETAADVRAAASRILDIRAGSVA